MMDGTNGAGGGVAGATLLHELPFCEGSVAVTGDLGLGAGDGWGAGGEGREGAWPARSRASRSGVAGSDAMEGDTGCLALVESAGIYDRSILPLRASRDQKPARIFLYSPCIRLLIRPRCPKPRPPPTHPPLPPPAHVLSNPQSHISQK